MNYLHNIEHLTADGEGFIYWKNISVEHYDEPFEVEQKPNLLELAERCKHIEGLGVTPTSRLAVWCWDWMADLTLDDPWLNVFTANFGMYESCDELLIIKVDGSILLCGRDDKINFESKASFFSSKGIEFEEGDFEYHAFQSVGFKTPTAGQPEHNGIIYATLDGMKKKFLEYKVVPGEL